MELYFCPTCGTLLEFELLQDASRLYCPAPTCPYVFHIKNEDKLERNVRLEKKYIEPIISDDDWKNAPPTDATCPVCSHDKAVSIEVPITADETSIFYKCLNGNCRHDWCKDVYL